ncbi:MAG: YraN family protein [Anaerolineae bacterium]|nr:YraN family protein [Anaerolineae bacterium]
MSTSGKKTGRDGEALAAAWLEDHEFTIVARNWHCPAGELDIVAWQGDTLVFVEVKTCHAEDVAAAFVHITPAKRQRLLASVYHYLEAHALTEALWRVDAIGIALPRRGGPILEHLEDALGW